MRNRRPSSAYGAALRLGSIAGALLYVTQSLAGAPLLNAADEQASESRELRRSFSISPGALDAVIKRFSRQAGLRISADSALTQGLKSPGVNGEHTVLEALQRLLSGTSVTYRFTGAKTLTLQRAAASAQDGDVLRVGPVTVLGESTESAYGPVAGYVPSRSATATKTDTPLIETPQSVSVITQDRMYDQDVDSLDEALRYTPGVQGETFGFNPRATSLKIRGFNAFSTGLYRDGLQLRTPTTSGEAFNPEPYGTERIEVLRGPASVLYGQSSPGGIVNLVTKRPRAVPFRQVELEGGNFDRYEAKLDLSGPLDKERTVAYRLTGLARESNTQIDFINNDRRFIAPALTWRPTDDTSITFLGNYQKDETKDFQFLPSQGTVRPNPHGRVPRNRFTGEPDFDDITRTVYWGAYLFEHHFGNAWTLRQNLRYAHSDFDRKVVFSGGLQADLRTMNRFAFGNNKDLDVFSLDNQAQVEFSTGPIDHKVLAGVSYQNTGVRNVVPFGAAPPIDIFDPVYGSPVPTPPVSSDVDTDLEQIGVYLQDQLKLYDHLILLLSGRHDWADTNRTNNLTGTKNKQSDKKFTGRVGLLYLSDIGLAPYVSYSESFLPIADTNLFGEPFDPETGQQLEAGVKYQPPGSNSYITVAGFDLTRQNVPTPDQDNPLNQVQRGEIRSRGVEMQGLASFDFGLDLIASYTYLDAEITKSNAAGEKGETPTQVPKHRASLWAKYTLQKTPLRGLGFGAGARYTGSTFADLPNTFEAPAFTMVDAAIYYNWRRFSLAVNARNLLNEDGFVCFSGGSFCSYGAARTVVGSVRYRW